MPDRQNRVIANAILRSPLLNRGSAFSVEERQSLHLEALLPAGVNTQAQQAARAYAVIESTATPLARYRELMSLQDRNEYLFYRVMLDHLSELMPIVYTPTVGEAAQRYSDVFQRGRGLWLRPEHRGQMREIIERSIDDREVRLVVATDNEAVLGLGDQGAGGMTISIGKLALYTACAGIAPEHTLPISLDVGTDNALLRDDPMYLGRREPRLRGAEYDALVDEFVAAMTTLFPDVLIQWEDFSKDNALNILDRYRERVASFNDDIQGTGAVTLAGVFSAMRASGQEFSKQRFLIYGAGAAGLGIARQIKSALRLAGVNELDRHIGLLDSRGLLVDDVPSRDTYKKELAWRAESANATGLGDPSRRGLEDVISAFRPTVLIGSSGQGGAFTETLIREIHSYCDRPVIMPLSNPTSATEALPADVLSWTQGKALIATGSPFEPVEIDGRRIRIGQGNNVFIFPALGLAAILGHVRVISDDMITVTAQALADTVTAEELSAGMLYPDVERLRDVTTRVATRALQAARDEGITRAELPDDLAEFVAAQMWLPDYPD